MNASTLHQALLDGARDRQRRRQEDFDRLVAELQPYDQQVRNPYAIPDADREALRAALVKFDPEAD